jgi:hypothetical protein
VAAAESGAEKIRRIAGELARIRNELKDLVREGGDAAGARRGGDASSEDPLEEILGSGLGALGAGGGGVASLDPEAEDVIVVDVSLPSSSRGTGRGSAPPVASEPSSPDSEKRPKDYPKKPPPRKQRK